MANRRSTDPSRPPPSPARLKAPPKSAASAPRSPVTEVARRELIAIGAYLRAERRGFAYGHAEEDWLAAEVEVDALLRVNPRGPSQ